MGRDEDFKDNSIKKKYKWPISILKYIKTHKK